MQSTEMLGYCLPAPEPPTLRPEIGVSFHPPGGYYLHQPQCPIESSPAPSEIVADLDNKELWEKFSSVGTEMILTKSGRRMFPEFVVSLSGLEPHCLYTLCVQAVPKGETRYKWRDGAWSTSGRSEPGPPTHLYMHPESPAPGYRWMDRPISFSKIRLTNNTLSQNGQIVLQSMHRYFLRLYIVPTSCYGSHSHTVSSISFPETSFIAVTSYQNPQLSLLKIEENPFAKGIKYFKNHQESRAPNKRFLCSLEGGDGTKGSKQLKESVWGCENISEDGSEKRPLYSDGRQESQEDSGDCNKERELDTGDSNQEDSVHRTQKSQEDSRDLIEESQDDSGDSSQERQGCSEDMMQERQGCSGDMMQERQEDSRRSIPESPFFCREGTQRCLDSADHRHKRQIAFRDCTQDSGQGRDGTHVTASARQRSPIHFAKNTADSKDRMVNTTFPLKHERSPGLNVTAQCGSRTHAQPWVSLPAVSAPPYSPSHCVMAQRLAFSYHPSFPSYPTTPSSMPSIAHNSPVPTSLWTPTPIRLSSNFSTLQPPVFQEMMPPPWYFPQHPICRGL